MEVRRSTKEDLPEILNIYEYARTFMKHTGNPNQWINGYPGEENILNDILNESHYVIVHEDKGIIGCFMFRIGNDSTYDIIEGSWLNNNAYGVIHRLASNGKYNGIAKICFDFCFSKINNIRVDTHSDNHIMQRAILSYGFQPCGLIYCQNGTPRLAFQLNIIKP